MKAANVITRYGGQIVEFVAVAHVTHRKVASWHFLCDVKRQDGSIDQRREVAPYDLVYTDEAGRDEINAACAALNSYLADSGEWHDNKRARDGRVYSWTPSQPSGERAL